MNELIEKVEQWAIDRNLHTASPQAQALKVVEEFTETLIAHDDMYDEEVIDGIGDTYVTLIILCQQLKLDIDFTMESSRVPRYFERDAFPEKAINRLVSGVAKGDEDLVKLGIAKILIVLEFLVEQYEVTPERCLFVAYDEIKDRKGKMIDGVFVKESDLHGNGS